MCECAYLPAKIVCSGDKCVSLPVLGACLPGEPRASRSHPGSRPQPGVSGGAHSSRGRIPPSRCGTAESDHDCLCSPVRLPAPAGSAGHTEPDEAAAFTCLFYSICRCSVSYREGDQVLGASSLVESRQAVFGPEVQVGSSALQDLDDLHYVVQVSCKRQRAFCKCQTHNALLLLIQAVPL